MTELRSFKQYAIRIIEDDYLTYIGYAKAGGLTSSAVWRIMKINEENGVIIEWADGNTKFDNIWDNYASLSYS